MTRLCLITSSDELVGSLRQANRGEVLVLPADQLLADPRATERVTEQQASAVVLDATGDPYRPLQLAEALTGRMATPVIMLASDPTEVALPALRSGVRDVLAASTAAVAIWDSVDRVAVGEAPAIAAVAEAPGRVISVLSPKGGVGKTTVATNLAVGLARALPGQVVLVDLDVQFGDVASALDLDPEYSIVDAVRGAARHDSMVLKTYLTQHRSGLSVVTGPDAPQGADQVSADDARDLVQRLAAEFAFVVVDTSPGLTDHTLAALDTSTDLVLLTALDVPGIRGLRKELDTLAALGVELRREVVVNMVDRRGGLTLTDAAATITSPIDVALPRCHSVAPSVNRGVPLLESGARSPFARQLTTLLHRLVPELPRPKRTSLFGQKKPREDRAVAVAPRRALIGRSRKAYADVGAA